MNTDFLLIIIALFVALVALVIAILALMNASKAIEKSEKWRIKKYAKEEYDTQTNFFLDQKLKSAIHDELVKQQAKNEPMSQPTETEFEPDKGKETVPEAQEDTPAQTGPVEIVLPAPKIWYTGSYTTGSFRHVTAVPDDKTIFSITANSEDALEGTLNIDLNAYAKVAQTPDYLEKACTWSGTGTRVKVIRTGTVMKEGGAWIVKEPIVVEFN